jgi:hypothetical protein
MWFAILREVHFVLIAPLKNIGQHEVVQHFLEEIIKLVYNLQSP